MNLLFLYCEGRHDAQLIGRILNQHPSCSHFNKSINMYPAPLKEFLLYKFTNSDISSLVIGQPVPQLVPEVVIHQKNKDTLILVIPTHGTILEKSDLMRQELYSIQSSFDQKVLQSKNFPIKKIAFLFTLDADSHGVASVVEKFINLFSASFTNLSALQPYQWHRDEKFPIALLIYTKEGEQTGTLEDWLHPLFLKNNPPLVEDANKLVETHYPTFQDDSISQRAKRTKSLLTICGQMEKECAGASLAVILKKSTLLQGIDVNDKSCLFHLCNLVDTAFSF